MIMAESIKLIPELQAIAFSEYGETKELRDSSLVELRLKIQNLTNESDRLLDLSDRSLIRFLRSRKFDLEKALDSTIQLQQFNVKHRSVLGDLTNDQLEYFSKFLCIVHEPMPSGRVILIMRPKEGLKMYTSERKKKYPHLLLKANVWMHQQISFDPYAQICGIVVIYNFNGITFWEQMTLSKMASVTDQMATFQHFQIMGTRLKGAFMLHEPPFLSWLWFIMKPFTSDKIRSRFFLCVRTTHPCRLQSENKIFHCYRSL